ncbi:MAG TPA: endonuclease/exonuclease/phosphatase family protein [Planctomycetota bacterium]|nr:endonuclease/exonuclease/phosphatase family protein [Planctomycetota bacterium]
MRARSAWLLLPSVVCLPAAAAVAASPAWWVFELFDHWAHIVAGGVALAAGAAALGRRRVAAALDLAAAAALAWYVAGAFTAPTRTPAADASGLPIVVACANLAYFNRDASRLVAWIAAEAPDVVVALEATDAHRRALAPALQGHPHRAHVDSEHEAGNLSVYSRFPLVDVQDRIPGGPLPLLEGSLDTPGGEVAFVALHAFPPLGGAERAWNRDVLDHAARRARRAAEAGRPCVVVGDFNASPWSRPFRAFEAAAGVAHARRGRGLAPTWPVVGALSRVGLPIDHVCASADVAVEGFDVGDGFGSDHRPIVARLRLRRAR